MTILGGFSKGPGGGPGATGPNAAAVAYVTERDFEREVLRSELPVLLEFTADWCEPCKAMLAPEVEAFARETAGKAKVLKLDVDRSPGIAQQLRIQSVPTFMVFAEGRPQDIVVGRHPQEQDAGAHRAVLPDVRRQPQACRARPALDRGRGSAGRHERCSGLPAHTPSGRRAHADRRDRIARLAELHMLQGQPVLYCRSGDRTKELAAKLADQGMPVAFLEGGILGWEAEGLRIER